MLDDICGELSELLDLTPGCAVGLALGDHEFFYFHGVESVRTGVAVSANTHFQIGSITKTMTATLCTRRVVEEKLQFDRPLKHYLPWFAVRDEVATERVTLRHLLTHQAGWQGDVFVDYGHGEDALKDYVRSMKGFSQLHPLKKAISYCNSGFIVAGFLLEEVCGTLFEHLIKEDLFLPLFMSSARFHIDGLEGLLVAEGHFGLNISEPSTLPRTLGPSGGAIMTVGELLRYLRYHNMEARLGDESALSEMYKSQAIFKGEEYGLGWARTMRGGLTLLSHGGLTRGQAAYACIVPELDLSLAVLTNTHEGGRIAWAIADKVLQRAAPLQSEIALPTVREQVGGGWSGPEGVYEADLQQFRIERTSGVLLMTITPTAEFPSKGCGCFPTPSPLVLETLSDSEFLVGTGVYSGASVKLVTIDEVEYLYFCGRLYKRI